MFQSSRMISPFFPLLISLVALSSGRETERPRVSTPRGELLGKYAVSRDGIRYETYTGIRFGHVPQRFDPSVPTGKWEGVEDAGYYGPHCAQISLKGSPLTGVEDCLFLNVFTPKSDNKKRGVFVYIHGGGLAIGSTLEYGGDYFIDEDIVVVTVSYRLGVLGFMSTPDGDVSGNNAFKDQVLALKWVQENIESFGGDKDRVTISGNSAGGASALYLLISPMARGLFHGIYDQSGTPLNPWGYTESVEPTLQDMGKFLNCEDRDDLVDCFRKAPLEQLIEAQLSSRKWAFDIFRVGASLEVPNPKYETFLGKSPEELMRQGDFPKVPLLLTNAKDEGSLIFGSAVIRNDALVKDLNENASRLDGEVFQYEKDPNLSYRIAEVSKKARQFYFGGHNIQKDDEQDLVDLFSDTWFLRGLRKTAKLLGARIPVYLGQFTYKRHDDYSPVAGLGITERIETVSHCEDLSYIFNPTGNENPFPHIGELKDPRDIDFSEKYVKMLASFIKTGVPTVPFGKNLRWDPILKEDIDKNSLKFLNFGENTRFEVNPYAKRMKFWDTLEKTCTDELYS